MSATWTCICGYTFTDYGAVAGDVIHCPTCGYLVGEAMPTRYDEMTAIEAEPVERVVLASPEVAVQAADPLAKAAVSVALDQPADVDIRIKSNSSPFPLWLKIVGCLLLPIVLVLYCVQTPGQVSGQRDAAFAQINGPLTQACTAYHVRHGEFPETLDKLLERDQFGQIYLEKPDALIDPWGKRYQFDPKGPRNNGEKPDIWTVHADGTVIGNWPKN